MEDFNFSICTFRGGLSPLRGGGQVPGNKTRCVPKRIDKINENLGRHRNCQVTPGCMKRTFYFLFLSFSFATLPYKMPVFRAKKKNKIRVIIRSDS